MGRLMLFSQVQRAATTDPVGSCSPFRGVPPGNVAPHRMSFVAVDPPFSLLHIDGICGQVPMHYCMTICMEVEPFLAHGRRREHEGPKWRIESFADLIGS